MLPQKLGDLDSPEYLAKMSEKVQKLQHYKYMLNSGSITDLEYISFKDQLLFGECEGLSACNDIEMEESYFNCDEDKKDELN